ncbi:MAG: hypothetical protein JWM99_151, partial [Verrucomicrobiales bacterium]|nr:hypothetical protein [Verrucomicrobiales bacterium]
MAVPFVTEAILRVGRRMSRPPVLFLLSGHRMGSAGLGAARHPVITSIIFLSAVLGSVRPTIPSSN